MRVIGAFLATEIHTGIARIVHRRLGARVLLLLETLLSRPGFDQRTVHSEVFVGKQVVSPRQIHHLLKERLSEVGLQQPLPVLGIDRGVPHRIVHAQTHKPAKQQVVIQLLHQQPFAAHAIQALQQERTQQLLGRDGGASHSRIHLTKAARQSTQHLVHQRPQAAQGMVPRYPLFGRKIAEPSVLLAVITSHLVILLRIIQEGYNRFMSFHKQQNDLFSATC